MYLNCVAGKGPIPSSVMKSQRLRDIVGLSQSDRLSEPPSGDEELQNPPDIYTGDCFKQAAALAAGNISKLDAKFKDRWKEFSRE